MQIRFKNRHGEIVETVAADEIPQTKERLQDLAKAGLAGFYEWDERAFWPKPDFRHNAPHVAELSDASGALLYVYSIADLVRDKKRHLTTRRF
jgi:hypothetical protein